MRKCYDVETFYSLEQVKDFLNKNKIPQKNVISVVTEESMGVWHNYKLLYVRTRRNQIMERS